MSSLAGIARFATIRRCSRGCRWLAGCVADPRAPERVLHSIADILRFRMLMIAAGYEDGNDVDSLRHDPAFKLALGRLPDVAALCSQPTISRLENLPRPRELLRTGQAMVALYCDSFPQVRRRIILDIDDSLDAVQARGSMAECSGDGRCE